MRRRVWQRERGRGQSPERQTRAGRGREQWHSGGGTKCGCRRRCQQRKLLAPLPALSKSPLRSALLKPLARELKKLSMQLRGSTGTPGAPAPRAAAAGRRHPRGAPQCPAPRRPAASQGSCGVWWGRWRQQRLARRAREAQSHCESQAAESQAASEQALRPPAARRAPPAPLSATTRPPQQPQEKTPPRNRTCSVSRSTSASVSASSAPRLRPSSTLTSSYARPSSRSICRGGREEGKGGQGGGLARWRGASTAADVPSLLLPPRCLKAAA